MAISEKQKQKKLKHKQKKQKKKIEAQKKKQRECQEEREWASRDFMETPDNRINALTKSFSRLDNFIEEDNGENDITSSNFFYTDGQVVPMVSFIELSTDDTSITIEEVMRRLDTPDEDFDFLSIFGTVKCENGNVYAITDEKVFARPSVEASEASRGYHQPENFIWRRIDDEANQCVMVSVDYLLYHVLNYYPEQSATIIPIILRHFTGSVSSLTPEVKNKWAITLSFCAGFAKENNNLMPIEERIRKSAVII